MKKLKFIAKARAGFAIAMFAVVGSNAWAQSLSDLIRLSLPTHPAIERAVSAARAAGFEVEAAKNGSMPKVITFLESGTTLAGKTATTSTGISSYGLKGTYFLYDGGRVKSDTVRAEAKKTGLLNAIELAELEVVQRMTELYLEAVKQESLVAVAKENLVEHERIHAQMLEIAQLDAGRKFDVEVAQVRLKNAQLNVYNREQAKNDVLEQLAQYAQLPMKPSGQLVSLPILQLLPLNLAAAQASSVEHPKLKQLLAELEVSKAMVDMVSAQTKPKLGVELAASSPKTAGQNREWFSALDAKLLVSYDTYDGGISNASINAAVAQAESARAGYTSGKRDIANEVARLWNEVRTRDARIPQLKSAVDQNAAVTTGLFELFKVGRRTILDLLNAQADRFNAKSVYVTEIQDTLIAVYRLKLSMGQMPFEVPRTVVYSK